MNTMILFLSEIVLVNEYNDNISYGEQISLEIDSDSNISENTTTKK